MFDMNKYEELDVAILSALLKGETRITFSLSLLI